MQNLAKRTLGYSINVPETVAGTCHTAYESLKLH